MKKATLLWAVLLFILNNSDAQIRFNPENPYVESSYFGVSTGGAAIFGHLQKQRISSATNISWGNNFSPNFTMCIEAGAGTLSSYTPKNSWTDGLISENNFTTLNLSGRYNFNNIFKTKKSRHKVTLQRLYWGFGMGIIENNLVNLSSRYKADQSSNIKNLKLSSTSGVISENIGYEMKLPHNKICRNTVLNLNFQANYALSADLDGMPSAVSSRQTNDIYVIGTIGLHFYMSRSERIW